ncbi:hypothetical protein C0991_001338 [Blastosporella zonata]|nr:hypothetical protein C0991_001338 [Blastosporella zonata]
MRFKSRVLMEDLANTLLNDLKLALGESSVTGNPKNKASRQNLLAINSITVLEESGNNNTLEPESCYCVNCTGSCAISSSSSSAVIAKNHDGHPISKCLPPPFKAGEQSLVSEASLIMAMSSRYYVTGTHINRSTVTLWYFDRSCIIRTVAFDFVKSPQTLALITYAVDHSDCKFGFDPHLVRSNSVDASNSDRVQQLQGSDVFFPSVFEDEPGTRFRIMQEPLVYSSLCLLGRGTTVYRVSGATQDEQLALKISWPTASRSYESAHLANLWHSLPMCRTNVPHIVYHDAYSAKELDLPRVKLLCPDLSGYCVDRNLTVLVTPIYQHLWEVDNIQEFKKAFIDCITCHYHAYKIARLLHRDISEDNVMFHRSSLGFNGVLNDWNMAGSVNHKGVIPVDPDCPRPTGTAPFMAIELLLEHANPPPHRYEHDLESFFYLLVWAALHFDLSNKGRLSACHVARQWQHASLTYVATEKKAFLLSDKRMETLRAEVCPEFRGLSVPGLSNPFVSTEQTPPTPVDRFGKVPQKQKKIQITRPRPPPSPVLPSKSRKRGWEPSFASTSRSTPTLASTSGYLDTPAKYRDMAERTTSADEFHEAEMFADGGAFRNRV